MSSTGRLSRGGPRLPYDLLAGVEPCPAGWLVVSAKLQGITISPQEPEVFRQFIDVLDYRPAFTVVALNLPLGLPSSHAHGGRHCDRDARSLLKWPRAGAIQSPPTWGQLRAWQQDPRIPGLSAVTRSLMPRIIEVYKYLGSYHQRTLYEVHPELSFFQLNEDRTLQYSKRTQAGIDERAALLRSKVPGVERVLQAGLSGVRLQHLLDGAANLWTARRIAARGVSRLPEDPEWDEQGFRMELVR